MDNHPKSWGQFKNSRLENFKDKKSIVDRFDKVLPVLKEVYPNKWINREIQKLENKLYNSICLFIAYLTISGSSPDGFIITLGEKLLIAKKLGILNYFKDRIRSTNEEEFLSAFTELFILELIYNNINGKIISEKSLSTGKSSDFVFEYNNVNIYVEVKAIISRKKMIEEEIIHRHSINFLTNVLPDQCITTINLNEKPNKNNLEILKNKLLTINNKNLPINITNNLGQIKIRRAKDGSPGTGSIRFDWKGSSAFGKISGQLGAAQKKFPYNFQHPILIALHPYTTVFDITNKQLISKLIKQLKPTISGLLLIEPINKIQFRSWHNSPLKTIYYPNPNSNNPIPDIKFLRKINELSTNEIDILSDSYTGMIKIKYPYNK